MLLQYSTQYLTTLLLLSLAIYITNTQVVRDINLEFLRLDSNNNYILEPQEIKQISLPESLANKHYNLPQYKKYLYPKILYKYFDTNKDEKISYVELSEVLENKWTIYGKHWQQAGTNHLLSFIDENQYFKVCDTNKNSQLQLEQFPACLHAVLTLDSQDYPWKIKSIYYKNNNMGYSYEEYKKLIPNFLGQSKKIEQYTKKLFNVLEWDENKIPSDTDDLIGPEQGKILQAIIIFTYLDNDMDGELSSQQALFYLKRSGGEAALKIVDADNNSVIDKFEFIAYLNYALCIECDRPKSKKVGEQQTIGNQVRKEQDTNQKRKQEKEQEKEQKKENEKSEQKIQDQL